MAASVILKGKRKRENNNRASPEEPFVLKAHYQECVVQYTDSCCSLACSLASRVSEAREMN